MSDCFRHGGLAATVEKIKLVTADCSGALNDFLETKVKIRNYFEVFNLYFMKTKIGLLMPNFKMMCLSNVDFSFQTFLQLKKWLYPQFRQKKT